MMHHPTFVGRVHSSLATYPTGLLNLRAALKHVMEHVIRTPHRCHNFNHKFVTLVTLRSPVRYYKANFVLFIINVIITCYAV